MKRREFIKVISVSGAGLVLAPTVYKIVRGKEVADELSPSVFLKIDSDGIVTVVVHRTELGQGAHTGLPMIVAEELDADWTSIRVEQALAHPDKYGNQTTGGSTGVRTNWEKLRKAGATGRRMLILAAAGKWGADAGQCRTENGFVIHNDGRKFGYGELVSAAAELPVPDDVELKDPSDFRIIGTSLHRFDTPSKLDGSARFGIDYVIPDMVYASIARPPVLGSRLVSYDDSEARAVKGVKDVFEVSGKVAVISDSTWPAFKAKALLRINWDVSENKNLSTDSLFKMFEEKSRKEGTSARREGDFSSAYNNAAKKIEAVYEIPFISHSPMEPMNCTAKVSSGFAELWVPTQNPQSVQRAVAGELSLDVNDVKVNITYAGGGFGRRLVADYAVEAALISRKTGKPVKVTWTREDDMTNDLYRPASYHKLSAGIDSDGNLTAWKHHVIAPSIIGQMMPGRELTGNPDIVDGAANILYNIPNIDVNYTIANTPVPVLWFRAVYHTQNPIANECFLDEIAYASGNDPLMLRQSLLKPDSRLRGVLERAADESGWGGFLPEGRGRGIACHFCFGSYVAQVAEVSVSADGKLKVEKVTAAVDCGYAVNPDILKNQIEGGIIFALSAALRGEITVKDGKIQQTNFDKYEPVRYNEASEIDVHIIKSGEAPGGIGEPGIPPAAPALCNAIYSAAGIRIRKLPVSKNSLKK